MPDGPAKTKALTEIADLLRGIRETCHTLDLARREDYEPRGWLTQRKAWRFASISQQAERMIQRIKAADPAATPGFNSPALSVPPTGAWILSRTVVWSDNPGIQDGSVVAEYAAGPAKVKGMVIPELSRHSWEHPHKAGNPVTSLAVTWKRPPDVILPGSDVLLIAKASDLGSTKGAGIEGDFVSFDPSLHASDDAKTFRFVWQGRPNLYANPGSHEEREFRLPIPTTKSELLHLNIGTGNTCWGKVVTYEYRWKVGYRKPVVPAKATGKKPVPPKKKGG